MLGISSRDPFYKPGTGSMTTILQQKATIDLASTMLDINKFQITIDHIVGEEI